MSAMLIIAAALVALSGLFSGLNLGLMSFADEDLRIVIEGSPDENKVRNAQRIRPLRGSHLFVDPARLPVADCLTVMHPRDCRPVFVFPWEGVTCVGASHMIELGTSWNPSVDDQALGRIHRFGQRRPCYVYRVVAQGSIDELVLHRQATKSSLCGLLKSKKFPTRSDPDRAAVFDMTDENVASRLWEESSRASDAVPNEDEDAPTVNDHGHGAPRAAEAIASVCEYANPDLWDAIDPRATESPFGSGPLEALRHAAHVNANPRLGDLGATLPKRC